MQFNQVIGQHSLKQNLISSVKSGNLPHAQLFVGNEGTGALAIALAYIQYIVCDEKGDFDSCGKCSACKKVQKLIHPDIHFSMPITKHPTQEYKAGQTPHSDEWIKEWRLAIIENPYINFNDWMLIQKNEGNAQLNINANECSKILNFLSLKSFESGYKFMIIWMAEYLGNDGNRLLKQIEEPEEKTIFILIAENYEQILGTIQSRTQLIKIPPLLDHEIATGLVEQKQIESSKALTIAALAEGNYRAAIQLLVEKDDSTEKLFLDWMQVLIKKNRKDWASIIEQIAKLNRDNVKYFLKYALFLLRKSLMHIHAADRLDGLPEREVAFCKYLSSRLSIEQSNELMELVNKMHFYVERNAHTKSLFMYHSFAISNLFKPQ
jgi:DNA polymerase-3 subunit delta'